MSLDGGSFHMIAENGSRPRYAASGQVIFWREFQLWALPFDLGSLQATGDPRPVLQGVDAFDVASDGTLAYVPTRGIPSSTPRFGQLVWLDRQGNVEELPIEMGLFGAYGEARLSRTGDRLTVDVEDRDGDSHLPDLPPRDVYIYDVEVGGGLRLTVDGVSVFPVWTPDGEWVIFAADHGDGLGIYRKRADGSSDGVEQVVAPESAAGASVLARSVSPDGTRLLYQRGESDFVGGDDLYLVALDESGAIPERLFDDDFTQDRPRFSPDGRFFAYVSDRTGRDEIYIYELATGSRTPVSQRGGDQPFWARDGSELYFRQGRTVMAATLTATEPSLDLAVPQPLFDLPEANPSDDFPGDVFSGRRYHQRRSVSSNQG